MTESTATRAERETLGFQAEVKQLLQLMIHSLYSNREIFLRELDLQRVGRLRQAALRGAAQRQAVRGRLRPSRSASTTMPRRETLTIADNGVGMSRDEVIANLGTIAKSGTREFFSQLTGDQQKDAHLIGQFGVGFYSSFIVADKVTVRDAPRRREARPGRALGVRRRRRVRRRDAGEGRPRHRDHAAPARRPGRPAGRVRGCARSSASIPTTSSSRSS